MESFKQGLSFLLFATTAYLLWVLSGMLEGQDLLFSMLALVAAAMACWAYGRWCLPHRSSKARRLGGLAALALMATALGSGWPRPNTDLPWEAWSPQRVEQLLAEGRPVYIDYTAKWCVTCQVNKRVYHDSGLRELILGKKVALLRADWTQEDPRITAALDALGKAAVPVNVLHQPGAEKPFIFPELLTAEIVRQAMNALP
jgi:thiol:disulfide interchange protein